MIQNKSGDNLKIRLGEIIRIYRKREGFTQEQLAKMIGVSAVTLGNYENGKSAPDVYKVQMLHKILRIPEGVIFGEPTDNSLVLYCPEGDFKLDENGQALCKTIAVYSPVFRLYNCRRFNYSCLESDGKIYLLYNASEIEAGRKVLVRFEGSDSFIIAEFDGTVYTDIKNGNKTTKINALAALVLGELSEYEKIE